MARGTALALATLALVTALAPPGLCPCWLLKDGAVIHPHVIEPGHDPHTHEYLMELFLALADTGLTPLAVTAGTLLAALASTALWREAGAAVLSAGHWRPSPHHPPPRPTG